MLPVDPLYKNITITCKSEKIECCADGDCRGGFRSAQDVLEWVRDHIDPSSLEYQRKLEASITAQRWVFDLKMARWDILLHEAREGKYGVPH